MRPSNVGRGEQTDPTLLRYASAITEQKKCWELLAQTFDRFQTLRNNSQQTQQHAMANNVAFVCKGLYSRNNWRDWKQIWPQLFKRWIALAMR